jgi:hypothetical protein
VAVTASGLSAVARAAAADVVARAAAAASRPSVVPGPTGLLPVSTTPASTGATGAAPPTAPPRPQQPKKTRKTKFTQTDISETVDPSAPCDPPLDPKWASFQRYAAHQHARVQALDDGAGLSNLSPAIDWLRFYYAATLRTLGLNAVDPGRTLECLVNRFEKDLAYLDEDYTAVTVTITDILAAPLLPGCAPAGP